MECYLPANLFSPVQQLTVRLFPLQEGTDFRADLYRSIITYATIRLAKGVTYQEVRTEIIELAAKISPALEEKIVQLFASEFSEVLKNRVVKEKASSTPKPLDHKIKQLSLSSQSDAVHPKYSFFSQRAPTVWKLDTVSQTFQSTQQSNSTRAIADQYISEYSHTADLSHESCCLCG